MGNLINPYRFAAAGGACTTLTEQVVNPTPFYATSDSGVYFAGGITLAARTYCACALYLLRTGSPAASMAVSIYTNNAGVPGTIVGDESDLLACSTAPTTVGDVMFTGFSATGTAAAYWVVIRFTDNSAHNASNKIGWSSSTDAGTAQQKYGDDIATMFTYDDPPPCVKLYTA